MAYTGGLRSPLRLPHVILRHDCLVFLLDIVYLLGFEFHLNFQLPYINIVIHVRQGAGVGWGGGGEDFLCVDWIRIRYRFLKPFS